ncbi:MAG: hypothetical protein Q7S77_00595 [Candidatus Staskawiczbacteria bacterium]|nr:hypothetical protein [Candidatus Staskawiczbacteria bacterium]
MITEDDRLDAADELFEELYQIVNNSMVRKHVPEIIERFMLLEKENMSVTYPNGENTEDTNDWIFIKDYFEIVGNNADKSSQIMFYPMFPEDARFGQTANYYVQRVQGAAAYGCESNKIIINMSWLKKETPRFLACCFIHELGHAQTAKKEGRLFKKSLRSQSERLREEIDMWTVDYKLMIALGGNSYRKASETMAFEINQWWQQKRGRPDHQGTGIALKYCWGSLSDADSNNERDLDFFYFCSLMAADLYFSKEGAKEIKLAILQKNIFTQYDIEENLMEILSKH